MEHLRPMSDVLLCERAIGISVLMALGATRVGPAVPAGVAGAGADHPAAALGALDRVLPRVEERGLAWRQRLARLGRSDLLAAVRVPLGEARLHLGREDPGLLLLICGQ